MNAPRRVWLFAITLAMLLIAVFAATARVDRNYRVDPGQHITVTVDSIDYRDDLTRVYGKLIGTPHTSQRIDAVTIRTSDKSYDADDIDGVDFMRWFQWEDEGIIPIEIDFAPMSPLNRANLVIVTARGTESVGLSHSVRKGK